MAARKAIHVGVQMELHALGAPGVWLERPEDLCVIICLLGQKRRTCLLPPVFPVQIFERIKVRRSRGGGGGGGGGGGPLRSFEAPPCSLGWSIELQMDGRTDRLMDGCADG